MPFLSGFNPFNPWDVLHAMRHPPPIDPVQPQILTGTPIAIEARSSDPGTRVTHFSRR